MNRFLDFRQQAYSVCPKWIIIQQWSNNVIIIIIMCVITTIVDQPRAIAIVLGHLGSTSHQLQQLSDMYLRRNCSVVAATCPPIRFLFAQHRLLRPVAQRIVRETSSLLRRSLATTTTTTTIPVVIHMFSNGGTFLLEELDRIYTVDYSSDEKDNNNDNDNMTLFLQHLQYGYLFYDSCPCYLHMPWALRKKFWDDAFPFPGWSVWGRNLYLLGASISLSLWCILTASISRSIDFWSCMERPPLSMSSSSSSSSSTTTTTSTKTRSVPSITNQHQHHNHNNNHHHHCPHLVYWYTTNDKVTDASRIDELVTMQRRRHKGLYNYVTAYRKIDSNHVRLHIDYPDEYGRSIDEALDRCVPQHHEEPRTTAAAKKRGVCG